MNKRTNQRKDPRASKHAKKRVKERCGVSKKTADRVAKLARERGVERENTKGPLRRWLDAKYLNSDANSTLVVWGDKAYVFSAQNVLVTCLQIPSVITKNMKRMIVQPA